MIEREISVENQGWLPQRIMAALPLVVLVVGLIVTAVSVIVVSRLDASERLDEIEHQGVDLTHAIEHRVDDYAETLVGVSSFMTVVPDPGRDEFDAFLATSEILARFPGAQAVSFNRKVTAADKGVFEESVRQDNTLEADGYPEFSIHPEGNRSIYYVVDFIVPLEGNEAAFGFDLGSKRFWAGAQYLVVMAAQGVAGDVGFGGVVEQLSESGLLHRQVIHACRNDPHRAWHKLRGAASF